MSCHNPTSADHATPSPGQATSSGDRAIASANRDDSSSSRASGVAQATASDGRPVRLITLDPGHFHAALVQKSMYADVDPVVHVYAPDGPDLRAHLGRIDGYNSRAQSPTHWNEQVYSGADFFQKMISDKAGNTVVLSGNNREKMNYITQSLAAGFHVLADKPMLTDFSDFPLLEKAFSTAAEKKVRLYDIMTERFEIATMLQRELSMNPEIFGAQVKGSAANPGVIQSSVHHFYKSVSGNTLTRPAWFFDVSQQGEGIVDVMTHLVDLVQWECFPDQALDYKKDIQVDAARHWPTDLSLRQFREITRIDNFPAYLAKNIRRDTVLRVYCNGEINYRLRGIQVRTTATWMYKDPATADDTYYSMMRGTRANLVIMQGAREGYKPTLYIKPLHEDKSYMKMLIEQTRNIQTKYPGVEITRGKAGWMVFIPEHYKEGHEAHFARVTQNFLQYLENNNMPAWEVPNMIAKYYTTTKALQLARLHK
jgi:predicted dehydrogenase